MVFVDNVLSLIATKSLSDDVDISLFTDATSSTHCKSVLKSPNQVTAKPLLSDKLTCTFLFFLTR